MLKRNKHNSFIHSSSKKNWNNIMETTCWSQNKNYEKVPEYPKKNKNKIWLWDLKSVK